MHSLRYQGYSSCLTMDKSLYADDDERKKKLFHSLIFATRAAQVRSSFYLFSGGMTHGGQGLWQPNCFFKLLVYI